jgi:hypothetical protein
MRKSRAYEEATLGLSHSDRGLVMNESSLSPQFESSNEQTGNACLLQRRRDLNAPTESPESPEPFTIAAVERATRHTRALLGWSQFVVDKTTRQLPDAVGLTANDIGRYAAEQWESLDKELRQSVCLTPLRDQLSLICEDNYTVGGIVATSVHEVIRELARRVWMALRSGVCATNTVPKENAGFMVRGKGTKSLRPSRGFVNTSVSWSRRLTLPVSKPSKPT